MPYQPEVDPNKEQDRQREKISAGLRAEQALPFIAPYLSMRKAELLTALNYYAINSDKDKVFETSVRISEVETILVQLKVETQVGKKAGAELIKE